MSGDIEVLTRIPLAGGAVAFDARRPAVTSLITPLVSVLTPASLGGPPLPSAGCWQAISWNGPRNESTIRP